MSEDVVKQIQSILGWPATKEQIQQAKSFVPDDLVERITASGSPDAVRAKVQAYRQHGWHLPDSVSAGRRPVDDRHVRAKLTLL